MTTFNDVTGSQYNPETSAESAGEFKVVPAGWYEGIIRRCEFKETKRGGLRLAVGVAINDGRYDGIWVWGSINFRVPGSKRAEQIGLSQFGRLCLATGYRTAAPNEPADLLNQRLQVKVGVERYQEQDRNSVKDYREPKVGPPRSQESLNAGAEQETQWIPAPSPAQTPRWNS